MRLTKEDSSAGKVLDNLYVGGVGTAYNKEVLKELGITHILTVANKIQPRFKDDFVYKIITAIDKPDYDIAQHFEESNEYIHSIISNPKNCLLIHCFAGKSRATSFTLAYLIQHKDMTLEQGLHHIWSVRPQAAPNDGFMVHLKAFEFTKFGKSSEITVLGGKFEMIKEQALKMKAEKDSKKEEKEDSQK